MERADGSPQGCMTAMSLYRDPVEPDADVVHGGRCAVTPEGGPAEDERPCVVFRVIGLGTRKVWPSAWRSGVARVVEARRGSLANTEAWLPGSSELKDLPSKPVAGPRSIRDG